MTLLHGAPRNPPASRPAQYPEPRPLLLGVVSLFVTGIFILFLSSGRQLAASRDESQKDSLSGAFNRRGD